VTIDDWAAAADTRYLADLTRREVARALRALSSCYVERREKLATGDAIATAGKRAAFALYYGPLHFLAVDQIARAVAGLSSAPAGGARMLVDLGCGTGTAGAAWALQSGGRVEGYDINPWAVAEANWTYRVFRVDGAARRVTLDRVRLPKKPADILVAYLLNELTPADRTAIGERLFAAAQDGHRVVIVEPIARGVTPWWPEWERRVSAAGGRADEWRWRVEAPALMRQLGKAAGLELREITARTLMLGFSQ
jgi:hypothetical protein